MPNPELNHRTITFPVPVAASKSHRKFNYEKVSCSSWYIATPLPTLTEWPCQTYCRSRMPHPYIKNNYQLMVANIRIPDTYSVPAFMHVCLYRLIRGKTLPEPLSAQTDMNC